MKKIVVGGLIALAMTTAFAQAALAAIPDGDGISSGSPPGLITSSTEKIAPASAGLQTPALASVNMGTKGESPQLMADIEYSSPAIASNPSVRDLGLAVASIGGGCEEIGTGSPPGLLAT